MVKHCPEINQELYHLRDIETKEILFSFRTIGAAFLYKTNMRFGLAEYYEVYDIIKKLVVEDTRTFFQSKRVKTKSKEWVSW